MKTVGIATTFRQSNWGSVLQAYATQRVVDNLGYKSYVIDYKYPNEYHLGKQKTVQYDKVRSRFWKWKSSLKHKIGLMLRVRPKSKMALIEEFIKKEINVTRFYPSYEYIHAYPPVFDIYLSGSDQIWNPNTMAGDMTYMFDYAPYNATRISFASSFSCNHINEEYKQRYIDCLSKFKSISVREANGVKIVKDLTGKAAKVVLDPTLMIDANEWSRLSEKAIRHPLPQEYILVYTLAYTYNPLSSMACVLEALQSKYNMPVIALNRLPDDFNGSVFSLSKRYPLGIYEFLFLMKNASIVATSSFHGTAFSINFGKPFITLIKGNADADDRIITLINNLGLSSNCVTAESDIRTERLNPYYDVKKVQRTLAALRKDSLSFIKSALMQNELYQSKNN